jgi:membrane-associated phospholipid phosphatase
MRTSRSGGCCEPMVFSTSKWKLLGILLLVGLVATTILMLTLAEIHAKISQPDLSRFDSHIQQEIHADTSSALTPVMFALTWTGSPGIMIPAVGLFAIWLFWRGLRETPMLLLLSTSGAFLLSLVLKLYYRRLRPDISWAFVHEQTFSFPSGHSVFAVVLYGTLVYLGMRHLTRMWERVTVVIGAVLLVLGIGYSRIYLGVHYPSDVVAGYVVGVVWLTAVAGSDWYVRRTNAVTRNER